MKSRTVIFSPEAQNDLRRLSWWLDGVAGHRVCDRYIERVERFLSELGFGSERGTPRDDVRPGLRIAAFEKSLTIAFTVDAERVTILRVFYRGIDWEQQ